MQENEDKQIEKLIEKVMKHSTLKSPSVDFTSLVMGKVEVIESSSKLIYEPLISKRSWVLIAMGFVGLMIFIFMNQPESSGWFNLNYFKTDRITHLFSALHPSKIVAFSIGLFFLMLLIQIPLLKRTFDKQFEF